MDTAAKTRENRLRRMAERQGLNLVKSRRRDPRAVSFGRYMIVDAATNSIVAGGHTHDGYDLDIDGVERYLTEQP